MSTKIYNAFKFKKGLSDLMPFLKKAREDIEKDTIGYYRSIRNADKGGKVRDLIELFKKARDVNSFEFNIESSIVILFHDTGIYMIFYFPGHFGRNDGGYFKKWEEWIEDFHYQNQGDKPEDISEEEWGYREGVWDDLIGYGEPISRTGLIWEINNNEFEIASSILKN